MKERWNFRNLVAIEIGGSWKQRALNKNRSRYDCKKRGQQSGPIRLKFKPGTDDLLEFPMVSLVELLIGKGYDVKVHDQNVSLAKVVGSNKEYIERVCPQISRLLTESVNEVMQHGETLVLGIIANFTAPSGSS